MKLVLEADQWIAGAGDAFGAPGEQLCLHVQRVWGPLLPHERVWWVLVDGYRDCGEGLYIGVRVLVRADALPGVLPEELVPQPDQRWVEL